MSEADPQIIDGNTEVDIGALQGRTERLEAELRRVVEATNRQLLNAGLRTAAVRAGMVDLDGLKLVDPSSLQLSETGEVEGADAFMSRLRKEKPWLFGSANSSSTARAPVSAPLRRKLATDMSYEEWREARQELLRRR